MLSVVVITKNEEDRIFTCLESVKWADEIIVVDNGSTDQTVNIAKKFTDNIFEFKGQDFSVLRNTGMEKAKGDWVFYLDADERVLKSLKEEIAQEIKNEKFKAYAVSRKNIIFGQNVNYGPYKNDWIIRLFKKNEFIEWVGLVHEHPRFDGKLGYLKHQLLHLTHRDVDHFMHKALEWSKIDAKLRFDQNHPKMTKWRFLRILLTESFNQGILRKGFFSGTVGVIDSVLQVFSMFLTYVRLWQMQQKKDLKAVYKEIDQKLIQDRFSH